MRDGEPCFVAVDVCKALKIGNPSQTLSRLDEDEKYTTLISNDGSTTGESSMAFINEPGLHSLVLGSRKPEFKAFKRWIAHDTIPFLHKNGTHIMEQETPQEATRRNKYVDLVSLGKDILVKALRASEMLSPELLLHF